MVVQLYIEDRGLGGPAVIQSEAARIPIPTVDVD